MELRESLPDWLRWLRRQQPILRAWTVFFGVIGVMAFLNEWAPYWVNSQLSIATGKLMAWLLDLAGHEAQSTGNLVQSSACTFRIIGECTAYYPCALYLAAVLATPASIKRRLWGIALGIPTLLAINQVRLLSLCYVSRHHPTYFETAHVVVWQSLIVVFTVILWILWAATIGRRS